MRKRCRALAILRLARHGRPIDADTQLRLLDAERSRLEAELAWVDGMVDYQQSIVNLEAAEGVTR